MNGEYVIEIFFFRSQACLPSLTEKTKKKEMIKFAFYNIIDIEIKSSIVYNFGIFLAQKFRSKTLIVDATSNLSLTNRIFPDLKESELGTILEAPLYKPFLYVKTGNFGDVSIPNNTEFKFIIVNLNSIERLTGMDYFVFPFEVNNMGNLVIKKLTRDFETMNQPVSVNYLGAIPHYGTIVNCDTEGQKALLADIYQQLSKLELTLIKQKLISEVKRFKLIRCDGIPSNGSYIQAMERCGYGIVDEHPKLPTIYIDLDKRIWFLSKATALISKYEGYYSSIFSKLLLNMKQEHLMMFKEEEVGMLTGLANRLRNLKRKREGNEVVNGQPPIKKRKLK